MFPVLHYRGSEFCSGSYLVLIELVVSESMNNYYSTNIHVPLPSLEKAHITLLALNLVIQPRSIVWNVERCLFYVALCAMLRPFCLGVYEESIPISFCLFIQGLIIHGVHLNSKCNLKWKHVFSRENNQSIGCIRPVISSILAIVYDWTDRDFLLAAHGPPYQVWPANDVISIQTPLGSKMIPHPCLSFRLICTQHYFAITL